MTRKDYEMIANIIAGDIASHRHSPVARQGIVNMTLSLAQAFSMDNPRFDRKRFLRACGFEDADAPYTLAD